MTTLAPAYVYAATVLRIIDGDTLAVDIDLGVSVHFRTSIRLLGIDAPERFTETGPAATAYLTELAPAGTPVVLRTVKVDKYGGRYDAVVIRPDGLDLSLAMLAAGHALPYPSGNTGAG